MRKTVMIVEDNELNMKLFHDLLEASGYRTIGTRDGLEVLDLARKRRQQWKLPGEKPHTYAVWVDPDDKVWLSEWAANAIVRFDPASEKFESFPSNRKNANVRQMLGRKGETWIAESGTERIRVIRHPVRTN